MAHILIVDDEECIRDPLSEFLRTLGHDVHEATNGREAIERLTERTFDLIISDVMMPVVNGFQLLRTISQHIEGRIPYIFLSSIDDAEGIQNAIYAGADDYLRKPCDTDQVTEVIERTLALRAENLRRLGPYRGKGGPVPRSALLNVAAATDADAVTVVAPSGAPALKKPDGTLTVGAARPPASAVAAQTPSRTKGGLLGRLGRLFGRGSDAA